MSRQPKNAKEVEIVERLKGSFGAMAEIRAPSECEEPILAPGPRAALFQWLAEIRARADLEAVGLRPSSRALLYGPPGTGKTTMAHHLAARLGVPLVCARSEGLVDKYVGETGKNLGKLMDATETHAGEMVLFIDEIDSVGSKRQYDQAASVGRSEALNVLLRRVERLEVPCLAATNRHDVLDSALWRRFDLQISVDLPGAEERFAILKRYAAPFVPPDEALDVLTGLTVGASPALLRGLMEGVKRCAVIWPKIASRDINNAAALLEAVVSSVAAPPELDPQPPLWAAGVGGRKKASEELRWPWERAS